MSNPCHHIYPSVCQRIKLLLLSPVSPVRMRAHLYRRKVAARVLKVELVTKPT